MSRRGKGEGSIRQRPDGIWEARVTIAPGRVKSLYGKTRTEVAQKLARLKSEMLQGNRVEIADTRLGTYLTAWLASKTLKASTNKIYKRSVKSLEDTCIWTIKLPDLLATQIRLAYKQDLAHMKPRMLGQLHETLRSALADAVDDQLIRYTPMNGVPAPKRAKVTYNVLTVEQTKTFISLARKNKTYGALFEVAVLIGAREGELLALEWSDIDFERKTLRIDKSLSEVDKFLVIDTPKTVESVRTIDLPESALEAFYRHKKLRVKKLDRPVFSGRNGKLTRKSNLLRRHFYPLVEACQKEDKTFPEIKFHELRHTCATTLIQAGVPTHNISRLLGHASIDVTQRIYGHVLPDSGKKTAARIDDLLGGVVKG